MRYKFESVFSRFITEFLLQKREAGFSYTLAEYILWGFDSYCIEIGCQEAVLTKELVSQWINAFTTDGVYANSRIQTIRVFARYLQDIGQEAYVYPYYKKIKTRFIHLMTDEETLALFHEIDNYTPQSRCLSAKRFPLECRVLFRLLYACGLRIDEACSLQIDKISFKRRTLTILKAKRNRDRLVYMSEEMSNLLSDYIKLLYDVFEVQSEWLFPAANALNHLDKHNVDKHFKLCWKRTVFSENSSRDPTPHTLRHMFVVKKLNEWMAEGKDTAILFPYLSKYLGHSRPSETFYYYHLVDKAFDVIEKKDKTLAMVIPEVRE